MQIGHSHSQLKANRPGFLLLMVLVSIAIGAIIIYFAGFSSFFEDLPTTDRFGDNLPWYEDFRLLEPGQEPEEPWPEQPSIEKIIEYDTNAYLDKYPRAEIGIALYPDGTVAGRWYGLYNKTRQINVQIMGGDFQGNIDPSCIYQEGEDDEDPSKLYFIAKGKFLLLKTNYEDNKVNNQAGDIYVTGWLDSDYKIMGKITITSNKKYFEVFTYEASTFKR